MKACRTSFSTLAVGLLLALPTQADWSWQIETVASTYLGGTGNALTVGPDGYAHVSFGECYSGSPPVCVLIYAWETETGWETEVVDSSGEVAWSTSIALDGAGWPHIAYYDNTNSDLKYARSTATGWEFAVVDDGDGVGQDPSLVLGPDGVPRITYYSFYEGLKYAWKDGPAWQTEVVDSTESLFLGVSSRLVLDSSGRPHVAYYGGHDPVSSTQYAHRDAGGWHRTTAFAADYMAPPTLVLDSQDRAHMILFNWHEYYAKYVYQEIAGGPLLVEDVSVPVPDDLIIDSADRLHLVASGGDYSLHYGYRAPGSDWTFQVIDPLKAPTGACLALSPEEHPRVFYSNEWVNQVRFARAIPEGSPTATPAPPTATPVPPSPTAIPTIVPTLTPAPTATPAPTMVSIRLAMPGTHFSQGDLARLDLRVTNPGGPRSLDLYVLLDCNGAYFAYPSWVLVTHSLDRERLELAADSDRTVELIPEFTIPPVAPAGPFAFHAALFEPGHPSTATLASNGDTWQFLFE